MCICIACTYLDHRDHELTDFRTAAANHKAYIVECLDGCKSRLNQLESYLGVIRQCDGTIAEIEASIHALATTFEKSLRIKEQELVDQISKLYGIETNEFIKRREELDEYFEQIKNTCSLTELVIHGKDIELLLVKKQLLDKFRELESVELDPLPENVNMHIKFQPGHLNLGTLKICEMTPTDDDECEGELDEDDEPHGRVKHHDEATPVVASAPICVSTSTQTDDVSTLSQAIQVSRRTPTNLFVLNGKTLSTLPPLDDRRFYRSE